MRAIDRVAVLSFSPYAFSSRLCRAEREAITGIFPERSCHFFVLDLPRRFELCVQYYEKMMSCKSVRFEALV